MWRKVLWVVGLSVILVDLSAPIHPVLGLAIYFAAAACMLPVCVRVRIG